MRGKLLTVTVLALCGAVALPGAASAAGGAETKVTIRAEGLDLSGFVNSPRPQRCAEDRKVIVFKQRGQRGGGNDERFATDNASLNGDRYMWSTGNTGTPGRFYARVRRIEGCKADSSRTIRAEQ